MKALLRTARILAVAGMLFVLGIVPVAAESSAQYDDAYFSESSYLYNRDLALLSAEMCDKATSENANGIYDLLMNSYDFDWINWNDYGDDNSYVLAYKMISVNGEKMPLLVVIIRGSNTFGEYAGDYLKGGKINFLGEQIYKNVYDYEDKVWDGIIGARNGYSALNQAVKMKVLVTGYSLGGAAANVVAARFDRCIQLGDWWSERLGKEDVYAYTFGAIKAIKGTFASEGYENIHNIYNYYDSFGPHGACSSLHASSPYHKFGHAEVYKTLKAKEIDFQFNNHSISDNYKVAVQRNMIKCHNDQNIDIATIAKIKDQTYTGKKLRPKPVVRSISGRVLRAGKDYRVEYRRNKKVGNALLLVYGKGKCFGTKGKAFTILPKGTTIKKAVPGYQSFTLKWKKQSAQTSGYEIQYANDADFTSIVDEIRIKDTKVTSTTVTDLPKNATYYARIRTYKSITGKEYKSAWSPSINVNIGGYPLPESYDWWIWWGEESDFTESGWHHMDGNCRQHLWYNSKGDIVAMGYDNDLTGESEITNKLTIKYYSNGNYKRVSKDNSIYTEFNKKGVMTRSKEKGFKWINCKHNKYGHITKGLTSAPYGAYGPIKYKYTYYSGNEIKTVTRLRGLDSPWAKDYLNNEGYIVKGYSHGTTYRWDNEYHKDEAGRIDRIDVLCTYDDGDEKETAQYRFDLHYGDSMTSDPQKVKQVINSMTTQTGSPSVMVPYIRFPMNTYD